MKCTNCTSEIPIPDHNGHCPTCASWFRRAPSPFMTAPDAPDLLGRVLARGHRPLGNGISMARNWTMDNQERLHAGEQTLTEYIESL